MKTKLNKEVLSQAIYDAIGKQSLFVASSYPENRHVLDIIVGDDGECSVSLGSPPDNAFDCPPNRFFIDVTLDDNGHVVRDVQEYCAIEEWELEDEGYWVRPDGDMALAEMVGIGDSDDLLKMYELEATADFVNDEIDNWCAYIEAALVEMVLEVKRIVAWEKISIDLLNKALNEDSRIVALWEKLIAEQLANKTCSLNEVGSVNTHVMNGNGDQHFLERPVYELVGSKYLFLLIKDALRNCPHGHLVETPHDQVKFFGKSYYLISRDYIGTNKLDNQGSIIGESFDTISIYTEPGCKNLSGEECVTGWLGSSGDFSRSACGEYDTLANARDAARKLGYTVEIDSGDDEIDDGAIETWITEAGDHDNWEAADWLSSQSPVDYDITAKTTDSDLSSIAVGIEEEAVDEGVNVFNVIDYITEWRVVSGSQGL